LHGASLDIENPAVVDGFIEVPVSFVPNPEDNAASLQFDLEYNPDSFGVYEVVAGEAAVQVDKTTGYSQLSGDTIRVIVAGFNQSTLSEGTIALVYLYPLDSASSSQEMRLSGVVVSDPYGGVVETGEGAQEETHSPAKLDVPYDNVMPQPAESGKAASTQSGSTLPIDTTDSSSPIAIGTASNRIPGGWLLRDDGSDKLEAKTSGFARPHRHGETAIRLLDKHGRAVSNAPSHRAASPVVPAAKQRSRETPSTTSRSTRMKLADAREDAKWTEKLTSPSVQVIVPEGRHEGAPLTGPMETTAVPMPSVPMASETNMSIHLHDSAAACLAALAAVILIFVTRRLFFSRV